MYCPGSHSVKSSLFVGFYPEHGGLSEQWTIWLLLVVMSSYGASVCGRVDGAIEMAQGWGFPGHHAVGLWRICQVTPGPLFYSCQRWCFSLPTRDVTSITENQDSQTTAEEVCLICCASHRGGESTVPYLCTYMVHPVLMPVDPM